MLPLAYIFCDLAEIMDNSKTHAFSVLDENYRSI